jgi:UDP-GlcNAc:undecaprenyl-phosphate/decaprenyl-phosphate GlcNAc-1-phosphate transferase
MSAGALWMDYLFVLSSAFIVSWLSIYFLLKTGWKGKTAPNGVPLVGGIALCLGFFVSCLWNYPLFNFSSECKGLIFGSLAMFFAGLRDDSRELSITAKLLAQVVSCAVLVIFGVRTHIANIPESWNIAITFLWVIGITNALNHLDVMDGLAASVAVIISLMLFLVSGANHLSAVVSLALAGSILGFMFYNLPPAKVYMGNSGSHLVGFILAATAILVSYASLDRKVALLSPLLILGFPIFDTAFLILIRVGKNKVPFKKSNDHLALRFLAAGYSKRKSLMLMSVWALFFAVAGGLVSRAANLPGVVMIIFVILSSLALGVKMWKVAVHD